MTQVQRVLAALQAAGSRGITQSAFAPPEGGHVIDGGGRITRLAARIHDLREQGYTILKAGERDHFDIYVLVGVPAPPTEHLCQWTVDGWVRRFTCRHCRAFETQLIGPVCVCGHDADLAVVGPWHGDIPAFLNPPAAARAAA